MNQQSQIMTSSIKSDSSKTPKKSQSILNQFDLNPIKQIDPVFLNKFIYQSNGYKESYSVRLPFLLKFLDRQQDEQNAATIEYVNIRLLTKKQNVKMEKFTIEVTTDNDLFFYFFHTLNKRKNKISTTNIYYYENQSIDIESYDILKQAQQLDGNFQQYYISTQQFLDKCKLEPQKYACILNIRSDTTAYLQIIQTLNYKDVEVLRYEMNPGDDDIIRQHVSYRYGQKRSFLNLMEGRIKDVNELVKLKNPQLILHIQKILNSNSSLQQNGYQYVNQTQNKSYQIHQSNAIENYAIKQ